MFVSFITVFENVNFLMPRAEKLLGLRKVLLDCVLEAFVPITDDPCLLQVEFATEAAYQVHIQKTALLLQN